MTMTPEEKREKNREYNAVYREKHREELRLRAVKYREDSSEKNRESRMKWVEANRDYMRDVNREYMRNKREETPEVVKEYIKQWRADNPELFGQQQRRSRATRAGITPGVYSVQEVLDAYGTDCHLCGEPVDLDASRRVGHDGWENGLHLDHVIPLSREGQDVIENVRPSHGLCNLRKHANA